MNKISKSALADAAGCSAQYIDKVQKIFPPIVDFIQDGLTKKGKPRIKVDRDGLLTKKFIADQLLKEPDPQKIKHKNKTKKKPKDKIYTFEEETTEDQPTPHATAVKYGTEQKHELEKEKLEQQIEQLELKNQQTRTDLIRKELTIKLFAKIHEIDQNQFKTLNIKVVPKISSVYNEANETNAKKILKIVGKEDDKDLKNEIVSMLNAGEEDRILENTKILEDACGEVLKAVQRETDDFIRNIEE